MTGSDKLRILALANQKGGVGKTTTAINLGTSLAAIGEKVMVIDIDPQGNASTGLGVPPGSRAHNSFGIMAGHTSVLQAAVRTEVPNLFVVPGNNDLVGFETEYMTDRNRAFRLRDAITAMQGEQASRPTEKPFTYILIDCPPSLNLLTLNALVAANAVIVPVQTEFFALEGISQLNQSIEQIRASLNPSLEIQGVVLTMHDTRLGLSNEVADEVRSVYGDKVYKTAIPRNVKVAEAPSFGKPILLYDYDCPGSRAYVALATEIIDREKAGQKAA
jgi:chromosome partitioning protein